MSIQKENKTNNALMFMYTGETVGIGIENMDDIVHQLSGQADEISMEGGYSLFFNPHMDEKEYESTFGIPGNLLVAKTLTDESSNVIGFSELNVDEIEQIKEMVKKINK